MFRNIDFGQVATLTRFTLKSEWRIASSRMAKRKQSVVRWWAFWSLLSYLILGAMMIRLFVGNVHGEAFVTATAVLLFYAGLITASNIFLSFGTGFLAPDETQIVAPLPVTSETFFFSRLTVLLTYTSVIALALGLAPAIGLWLYLDVPLAAGITLVLAVIVGSIASALAIVAFYGAALRRVSRQKLLKAMSWVQMIGALLTAITFVVLPRLEAGVDLSHFTISSEPWLAWMPPVWFAAIVGIANGLRDSALVLQCGLAVIFLAAVSGAAHVLLGKHYQTDVVDLSQSAAAARKPATAARHKREPALFRLFGRLFSTHEARAVMMLFRAQFRYDARFRMALIGSMPITILYLVIALFDGGITDPFTHSLRSTMRSGMLYLVALLMPLLQLQSVSQSDNFKASWIFFSAPLNRARLLLAVRNILLGWIIIPYMILLAVVFSFFMSAYHAVLHVAVLAGMAGFIFQIYLMIAPRMPFAQQRRPNRTNYAMVIGIFFFSALGMLLLAAEVYWGYRSMTAFWTSFALIVTLSILMEQLVRLRITARLSKEEFEG